MRLVDFIGVLRRYQDKPSGYTIALVVLALALGVRELLDPYIKIPYVTLFPAMVVCSLVGGRLAGLRVAGDRAQAAFQERWESRLDASADLLGSSTQVAPPAS